MRGKEPVEPVLLESSSHLQRASWLTSMVESGGVYGTVQNFDGTGMTAGIHQAIAVYPKQLVEDDDIAENDQGPLWELVRRIGDAATHSADPSFVMEYIDFSQALLEAGWYISPAGVLVHHESDGKVVNGYEIREELTGSRDGVMPVRGEERDCAEEWVRRFHRLFSHPATFTVQQRFGAEHFCRGAKRKFRGFRLAPFLNKNIQDTFYEGKDLTGVKLLHNSEAVDLALCMFWNYNVNAPAIALEAIKQNAEISTRKRRLS